MSSDPLEDDENIESSAAIEKIWQLQAERERKREYTDKLEEKLKALNNELAARTQELDKYSKALDAEQKKVKQAASKRRDQGGHGGGNLEIVRGPEDDEHRQKEKVRHFIEETLQRHMRKEPAPNALGIRTFDERDLMVQQRGEMDESDQMVGTVLVHYIKPNSEERFSLSFRIGKDTTVRELKDDACTFWNESQVEYILTTVENCKCHDDLSLQKCFRRNAGAGKGDPAELVLQKKDTKRRTLTKDEAAQVQAKGKNKWSKKKHNTQEVSTYSHATTIEESMKKLPGLYAYMTQRDQNELSHLGRIKLRSICVNLLMIMLTYGSVYHLRQPNDEYFVRLGAATSLTSAWADEDRGFEAVTSFEGIRSIDHAWIWLTYTLPKQVFYQQSTLRRTNYVPGYIQIRMQQVTPPENDLCTYATEIPAGVECYAEYYSDDTQGTDEFEGIRRYWEGYNTTNPNETNITGVLGTDSFRSGNPWQFLSAEAADTSRLTTEPGWYQNYDASGYIVQYDVQANSLTDDQKIDFYRTDMDVFRSEDWLSPRTRAVHVNIDMYNGNKDYWMSCWFLIEFPSIGVARPHVDVQVYRSLVYQTGMEFFGLVQLFTDLLRVVGILYISVYQVWWEIKWEHGRRKSAYRYIFHAMGICDIGCGVVFVIVFVVRYFVVGMWGLDHKTEWGEISSQFWTVRQSAVNWRMHTVLEGILLMFLGFRLCTFLRVNRQFFVLWQTLRSAAKVGWLFLLIFAPIVVGFAVLSHSLLGAHWVSYIDLRSALTAALFNLQGGPRQTSSGQQTYSFFTRWKVTLDFIFYLVCVVMFVNSWIAVILSEYQRCRVALGYNPKHYRWAEYQYAQWCLWKPVHAMYRKVRGSRMKLPVSPQHDDDD